MKMRRFRRLFGLDPRGDVDAELSFHLEMRARELERRGVPPPRARELALHRFGDYDGPRRECVAIVERRRQRMARMEYLTELRQDIGYALRLMRRTPGVTLVAVLTLALGIGANSAIFSVVHGVLLASLPYREPATLHQVRMLYPDGTIYGAISAPDFMSVREHSRVFEQVEVFTSGIVTMLDAGEPQEIRRAPVSDGLFAMLGFQLRTGRAFDRAEHQPGAGRVVVLDHGFWLRAFGGDDRVLGRRIRIAGDPHTIVGVLAEGAKLPDTADLYVPLTYTNVFSATTGTGRRSEFLFAIGRARAGVASSAIEEDVRRLGTELQRSFPNSNAGLTFTASPLRDVIVGDVRRPLWVLLGAVGFVLVVACVNVANLLLARSSAREAELAVRGAIGAGRGRLVRQLLTEALVLGVAGAALGLGLAYAGTKALVAARPDGIPRIEQIGVNGTVVLFTLAIGLLTSIVFGILPAWQVTGARLMSALREGGRSGTSGRATERMRAGLVIAEMALAVVLLVGSGLLIRSLVQLTRVDPGFRAEQAMAFRISLQGEAYSKPEQVRDRVTALEQRLRALPGVTATGVTTALPLSGLGAINDFAVEGAPPPPPNVNQEIALASVTPEYFRAIGAPLMRGRFLSDRDHTTAPLVAVINEAGVRRWFSGQDPIGRRVNMSGLIYEIVGVVGDVLQRDRALPAEPQIFVPHAQRTTRTVRFAVRTAGDPLALAPSIRAELRALDPNVAIAQFTPLDQLVAGSIARPRFYTTLLTLFAAIALTLAAIGIFGVMSYAVAQRAREIGIRIALGAHRGDVLRMIVGRALMLAGVGVVLGFGAAVAVGRVIQNQLFGVRLIDLPTFAAVLIVLVGSAAIASLLPAVRASRVDPGHALR